MRSAFTENAMSIFFAAIPGVLIFYWGLVPEKRRAEFLLLVSLGFSAALAGVYSLFFLGNIVFVYFVSTRNAKSSLLPFQIAVVWLVSALIAFKLGSRPDSLVFLTFGPAETRLLFPIGLSYITFRLIHFLIDAERGKILKARFAEFGAYVLFFPTFLAGPIERFQPFNAQIQGRLRLGLNDLNAGLFRISLGLIKKLILAHRLQGYALPVLKAPDLSSRLVVLAAIYALMVTVYLDFSGYTDIAIGLSRLFGIRISENFDRPFAQPNAVLFWRHWHITINTWARDYFFLPIFGLGASRSKLLLGLFCTILVFQLWHGITVNFLIIGVYYGLGLVVWQLFQEMKLRSPALRSLSRRSWFGWASVLLTFTHVSLGVPFFMFPGNDGFKIFDRLLGLSL